MSREFSMAERTSLLCEVKLDLIYFAPASKRNFFIFVSYEDFSIIIIDSPLSDLTKTKSSCCSHLWEEMYCRVALWWKLVLVARSRFFNKVHSFWGIKILIRSYACSEVGKKKSQLLRIPLQRQKQKSSMFVSRFLDLHHIKYPRQNFEDLVTQQPFILYGPHPIS